MTVRRGRRRAAPPRAGRISPPPTTDAAPREEILDAVSGPFERQFAARPPHPALVAAAGKRT